MSDGFPKEIPRPSLSSIYVREIHFKDNHAESLWFHPSTAFETPHPVARFCVEKISNKGNIVYVERACAMEGKT